MPLARKRFSVRPQLGPLQHVATVVPTPHGDIRLTVDRSADGGSAVELLVPEDTAADVTLSGQTKTFRSGLQRWAVGPQ